MNDPLGYFLTWATYGTWLPGDSRGWVEFRQGWKIPNPIREAEAKARMADDACCLAVDQRQAVGKQIAETCGHRGWDLHAVNCRSNHIHVVVATVESPRKVRIDLKAWATRCLKTQFDSARDNWWAERGSIRFLFKEESVEAAVTYVLEGQDRTPSS